MTTDYVKAEFNLEEALAGAKVVTRDGREVTDMCLLNKNLHGYTHLPVFALVNTPNSPVSFHRWDLSGRYWQSEDSELDLFIRKDKVKTYYNVYNDTRRLFCGIEKHSIAESVKSALVGGALESYLFTVEIPEVLKATIEEIRKGIQDKGWKVFNHFEKKEAEENDL